MRTVPADLPQQVATAVGAAPTPIPWPELFTSLQTGVVEGTANGITDIMSMKFPDAGLKYLTLDGHSYMGAFWWMSNDRFQGLTPEQKQVVVDGFAALQQATFASPKRKEIAAYQDFAKAGGEIYVPTAAEKEAFKTAVAPVFDWFKTNVTGGAEVFDQFTAAVAEAQKKVDAERAADLN
jgi:TRAP-type transport system periplasmic protein